MSLVEACWRLFIINDALYFEIETNHFLIIKITVITLMTVKVVLLIT